MSSAVVVLGSAFGDEGKAKVVDYLSNRFDYVVRYQGGDNAGHSVVFNGRTYIFRLIPSGILQTKAIISHGVVLNPEHLLEEISNLEKTISLRDKLFISNNVHIICDWDILLDKLFEKMRNDNSIGTTLNGIGPTYAFKALRIGIRAIDLLCLNTLREKIDLNLRIVNPLLEFYKLPALNLNTYVEKYHNLGSKIKPYLCDSFSLMNLSISENKKLLFEGSQGLLLDLDMGTYPFVTSSNIVGFLTSGTGLSFSNFDNSILGVVKVYMTRVGNGELVTEIADKEISDYIRETGNEYGSATGRARRIGWLDLVAIKYSFLFSGATKLALTLIDVLNGLKQVKICVDYVDEKGQSVDWQSSKISSITPVYKIFKGWSDDYSKIKKYSDFSDEFRVYAEFISNFLNVKISLISFGKDRNSILEL